MFHHTVNHCRKSPELSRVWAFVLDNKGDLLLDTVVGRVSIWKKGKNVHWIADVMEVLDEAVNGSAAVFAGGVGVAVVVSKSSVKSSLHCKRHCWTAAISLE
jgi:uncharacterized membrane-anchored protein YjiN (DUF445 family)